MQPIVSVVITTKNEEENIENCLQSIWHQSFIYDKIEVVVVDNNSTDRTKEIAKKYTENVFNFGSAENFSQDKRSAQRNYGIIKKSQGEYVLYLDADMILSRDVIKECVEKMQGDQSVVGLYIPEIISGKNWLNKVRCFERSFYNATVIDAARFIRRRNFIELNGFDQSLTGPEDWDLDKRLKKVGQVGLVKSPLYHNESKLTLKKYLQKKSFYNQSFNKYVDKWGRNDSDLKKQLGFYYRFIGVFVENGKWKKIIKHPILSFGMYFVRGMVGLIFLLKNKK